MTTKPSVTTEDVDAMFLEGLRRDHEEREEIRARRAAGEPPKFAPGEGIDFVDEDDAVRGLSKILAGSTSAK
jgi:hypothetical protein